MQRPKPCVLRQCPLLPHRPNVALERWLSRQQELNKPLLLLFRFDDE
jgi:hypothetical protein